MQYYTEISETKLVIEITDSDKIFFLVLKPTSCCFFKKKTLSIVILGPLQKLPVKYPCCSYFY